MTFKDPFQLKAFQDSVILLDLGGQFLGSGREVKNWHPLAAVALYSWPISHPSSALAAQELQVTCCSYISRATSAACSQPHTQFLWQRVTSQPDPTLKSGARGQVTPACSSHAQGVPGRAVISRRVLEPPIKSPSTGHPFLRFGLCGHLELCAPDWKRERLQLLVLPRERCKKQD